MSARQAGDWVVVSDGYTVYVSEARIDGTTLAFAELHVGQFIGDLARAKRRAHLMAASKDLLNVAMKLRSSGCVPPNLAAEIDAAISKAAGESE